MELVGTWQRNMVNSMNIPKMTNNKMADQSPHRKGCQHNQQYSLLVKREVDIRNRKNGTYIHTYKKWLEKGRATFTIIDIYRHFGKSVSMRETLQKHSNTESSDFLKHQYSNVQHQRL